MEDFLRTFDTLSFPQELPKAWSPQLCLKSYDYIKRDEAVDIIGTSSHRPLLKLLYQSTELWYGSYLL